MRLDACLFCFVAVLALLLGACRLESGGDATLSAPTASAAAPTAPLPDVAPIIKRLASQGGCKDSTAEMRLTFTGDDGRREQLDFRLQRRYAGNEVETLITVRAPREETAKSLLALERAGQPTEAFSYLAGLKSLTKLGSDRVLNFRGTRNTVQEMLGLELNQYAVQKVERVAQDGAQLLKVDLKEPQDRRLAFPRIVAFLREAGGGAEPVRFDLYDGRGEIVKVLHVAESKTVQGYPTITRLEIDDKEQNRRLELVTREIQYDRALPASLFTEGYLIKTVTEASRNLVR